MPEILGTAVMRGRPRPRNRSSTVSHWFTTPVHTLPGGFINSEIVVANRAQRCEIHKLAVVWWVGGMWFCVRILCWLPFWSRTILRAI